MRIQIRFPLIRNCNYPQRLIICKIINNQKGKYVANFSISSLYRVIVWIEKNSDAGSSLLEKKNA